MVLKSDIVGGHGSPPQEVIGGTLEGHRLEGQDLPRAHTSGLKAEALGRSSVPGMSSSAPSPDSLRDRVKTLLGSSLDYFGIPLDQFQLTERDGGILLDKGNGRRGHIVFSHAFNGEAYVDLAIAASQHYRHNGYDVHDRIDVKGLARVVDYNRRRAALA